MAETGGGGVEFTGSVEIDVTRPAAEFRRFIQFVSAAWKDTRVKLIERLPGQAIAVRTA